MTARALFALLPLSLVVACAAAPADDETSSDTSEALQRGTIVGGGGKFPPIVVVGPVDPGPPGAVPAYPPSPLNYCPAVDPKCHIQFGDAQGFATMNAELHSWGCTSVMQWYSGYSAGWLGGLVALCSDSLALRQHYPAGDFSIMNGACDACIPKAPAGQVWIALEEFVGPNCQSGCASRNYGGW